MSLETIRSFLGWAALFNLIMVTIWFTAFLGAHDRLYALHRRWFRFSVASFDAIHYCGIAFYKAATWMFFIIPYLVLRLIF